MGGGAGDCRHEESERKSEKFKKLKPGRTDNAWQDFWSTKVTTVVTKCGCRLFEGSNRPSGNCTKCGHSWRIH